MSERVRERRTVRSDDVSLARQRAITEQLLLAALREHDITSEAVEASRRAIFLAATSRALAMSLDYDATRDAVRRCVLPRDGSWCIVDIVESNGVVQRLPVTHPEADKQAVAQTFADLWFPPPIPRANGPGALCPGDAEPAVFPNGGLMMLAPNASSPKSLERLRALGFGGLVVLPLVVRATVLGTITFITRADDPPLSAEELALAAGLAGACALALDNARLYREAGRLRSVADEANRAKSAFLGNMSHELMTPLNAIGGYVTLIEMGIRGPVTVEQLADLARIRDNQTHLLTLISEILHFARSGSTAYRLVEVSTKAALQAVAEMLAGLVSERRLSIVQRPSRRRAVMWADADRVRQILVNLVMNAVKYGAAVGGEITLSSAVTRDAVSMRVADNGPGIAAEQLATIFDPFVQLASGLTDRRGGVGLGLALSRDLARAMNGELTVASTVGVGSEFTLTLPRAKSRKPTSTEMSVA